MHLLFSFILPPIAVNNTQWHSLEKITNNILCQRFVGWTSVANKMKWNNGARGEEFLSFFFFIFFLCFNRFFRDSGGFLSHFLTALLGCSTLTYGRDRFKGGKPQWSGDLLNGINQIFVWFQIIILIDCIAEGWVYQLKHCFSNFICWQF